LPSVAAWLFTESQRTAETERATSSDAFRASCAQSLASFLRRLLQKDSTSMKVFASVALCSAASLPSDASTAFRRAACDEATCFISF
jgi:hypothetical protein